MISIPPVQIGCGEGRRNRILPLLFALLCLVLAPAAARAGPALVFDTRTGEVLHAYGAYTPWHPASLTKLMTIYVAFRAVRDGQISMSSPVRISARALAQPPSKMGFPVGFEITLDQALRILMVKSANDIAVAVAEAVGGSHDAFVARMNSAARRLDMSDTFFANPHGLHDPRQRTTARDLALLARALIREFPQYQGYFEISSYQIGKIHLRNHNKLIGSFRGADGMKTGYVCTSGFNIVATATRGGRRLAAVVLGGIKSSIRDQATASLLEAGFQEGTGFSLIGGRARRPTVESLPRPAAIGPPVDMRPYVCQKKAAPPDILSFGMETGTAAASSTDPSQAVIGRSGSALALAAVTAIDAGPLAPGARPEAIANVPLPRPRPGEAPKAQATKIDLRPSAASSPVEAWPRPNPLR